MAAPPIVERHKHHFHRQSPIKETVRVATTASITIATDLNVGDTIDGVVLADGDRVLVKDQGTGSQNGIYVAGASPARDYDVSTDDPDVRGSLIYVRDGTANGGKLFRSTNLVLPTIGTTSLVFAEFTGGGAPTTVDYLVGTASGSLSNEIVVGTTPGGELGGTWASPTIDTTHAGTNHLQPVRKNSAGSVFERRRLNFIEGSNVTLTVADDAGDDEVDVTIAATGGSGGTVDIEDEGAAEGAADTIDFVGAGVSVTFAAGTATVDIPGGGSGGGDYSSFALDTIPASAHADDDEFPGSSLDAKWTDPISSVAGGTNTTTVANGSVVIEPATGGTSSTGLHVFGIRQNSPTGSFTVTARLGGDESNTGSDLRAGIFVAVTGGKAHVTGNFRQDQVPGAIGVTTYSESADWSSFDGYTVTKSIAGFATWMFPMWSRIRWDSASSTLFFDYTFDGIKWTNINSRAAMTQPDRMGICIYSNSGTVGADVRVACDWFRVTEP